MVVEDRFYKQAVNLIDICRGRTVIRCRICKNELRGEQKEYLDLRTWFANEDGLVMPGKGFAKPFSKVELLALGTAIVEYASQDLPRDESRQPIRK